MVQDDYEYVIKKKEKALSANRAQHTYIQTDLANHLDVWGKRKQFVNGVH